MIIPLNPEVVIQIEYFTASFLNLFRSQMEKCSDEVEYFKLLIAVAVFKNMALHHFKTLLREEGNQDIPGSILTELDLAANLITQNILTNLSQNNNNIDLSKLN